MHRYSTLSFEQDGLSLVTNHFFAYHNVFFGSQLEIEPSRFASTLWSVVLRAGGPSSEETRGALDELVQTYWYPLYAYSRRCGNSDDDAMDLTQGFFAHLLECNALESVSPDKGRFRSFLLAAFKNFMANERRAAGAIRRGGKVQTFSMSEFDYRSRYDLEPTDERSPDRLFERSWVVTLLDLVQHRLEFEYQRANKKELFDLLKPHLTHRGKAVPRADICRQLDMSSAAVAMSLYRIRRRYGELLRGEVSTTVQDEADIEDELRTLMEIVSRAD